MSDKEAMPKPNYMLEYLDAELHKDRSWRLLGAAAAASGAGIAFAGNHGASDEVAGTLAVLAGALGGLGYYTYRKSENARLEREIEAERKDRVS